MKRIVVSVIVFLIAWSAVSYAQQVPTALNGIYVKERDKNRKPVPYPPLREADVMWSKTVVRKIDLREKMNLPLFYPLDSIGDRKSLIMVLLDAIKSSEITAYDAATMISGREFQKPMAWNDIQAALGGGIDSNYVTDPETGEQVLRVVDKKIDFGEVKSYFVKEIWYFDRKYSSLQVRIIGLCPQREYFKNASNTLGVEESDMEEDEANLVYKRLFWVHFAEARPIFARNIVYNTRNDAEYRTFDDLFFSRYFASYIFQESNVYEDRNINDYALGINALLEGQKITETIRNFEDDLWEY
jgi:gliding motility associated protien GldN